MYTGMLLAELNQSQLSTDADIEWPLMSSAKNKLWYHFHISRNIFHWPSRQLDTFVYCQTVDNCTECRSAMMVKLGREIDVDHCSIWSSSTDGALQLSNTYCTCIHYEIIGDWTLTVDGWFNSKCSFLFRHFVSNINWAINLWLK